jgi:hypothetical protein
MHSNSPRENGVGSPCSVAADFLSDCRKGSSTGERDSRKPVEFLGFPFNALLDSWIEDHKQEYFNI